MSVEIAEPGLHYSGTLEFLGVIVSHLKATPRVEGFPGIRKPRAEMPLTIDTESAW